MTAEQIISRLGDGWYRAGDVYRRYLPGGVRLEVRSHANGEWTLCRFINGAANCGWAFPSLKQLIAGLN